MDDFDWTQHQMQQEAARLADEDRIRERERRRVARELGLEYVPPDEPVIEAEPVRMEPVNETEPEPEFDVEAVKAIFQKLIDAVTRR